MDLADFLSWLIPRLFAWLIWAGLCWFLVGKFGYRGKARFFWLIPLLVPPTKTLVPIGGTALILLILLPWPIWKELRRVQKLIDNRPPVKPTNLKLGWTYYIQLIGNHWVEAKYSGFATAKGKTRYCFVYGEKTITVSAEKIRAT